MEPSSTYAARGRPLLKSERIAVLLVCLVIFTAHLAFAGGTNAAALCITAAYSLTAAALVIPRWGRQAPPPSRSMAGIAMLYAITIAVALLSLSTIPLDPPHSVWSLVGAPSTPSVDRSRTLVEIIKLLGLACIFAAGAILGQSATRARYLLTALGAFSFAYGLWAFISFIAWPGTFMGLAAAPLSNRLLASFSSANTAGTFFGMVVILSVGLLTRDLARAPKARPGRSTFEPLLSAAAGPSALAFLAATALLLTASRSAVAATGAVLLVFVLVEGVVRRWRWRVWLLVLLPAALLVLGILLTLSGTAFFQRLDYVKVDAASRAAMYAQHIQAMKPDPWMGLGLGAFEPVHRQLINSAQYDYLWNIRAMHNVYLQWRQGAGWLGSAPMFLCIALALLSIAVAAANRRPAAVHLRIVLAMSAVVLLHGATDFALEEFSLAGFWAFLLGIGVAQSRRI
jgi:O-antigen ligase